MNSSTSRPASGEYRPPGLRLVPNDLAAEMGMARRADPGHSSWLRKGDASPRRGRVGAGSGTSYRTFGERLMWAFFLLVAIAGALWEFVHLPDASARLDAIPESGFGFAARELMLSETERAIFGEARVVKRLYQVGRHRFVLQVIDASRDRHAIHDPLFCFRGAGWFIEEDTKIPIPGGSARRLGLQQPGKTAEALLWFSDTQVRHASTTRQWAQTILRRVSFGASGPEPVLVILQPLTGESVNWTEVFEQFPAIFEI